MQNGSSVGTCTRCVHVLARLGANLYAQSVLIDKISVSELSRKFIKSALLAGLWVGGVVEVEVGEANAWGKKP